jgi:hypothetical protein
MHVHISYFSFTSFEHHKYKEINTHTHTHKSLSLHHPKTGVVYKNQATWTIMTQYIDHLLLYVVIQKWEIII